VNKKKSYLSQTSASAKKQTAPRIGAIFIFLIVLFFYFVPKLASAAGMDTSRFTDYLYLYTISSYTLIVLGVIIFQGKGLEVIQDHFSLWIIVLVCLLAASQGGKQDTVYKVFLVLLALRLSIHILVNRKDINLPDIKSAFIGLLWSVVTIAIIVLFLYFLDPIRRSLPPDLSVYLLSAFVDQVSFVTVIEEACFRGLLFTLLVMNGYQEDRALIIQAILFWGVHYMKIGADPASFFIALPILTLSTTLIIKEYKLLYLSVMLHTLVNVFGPVLVAILQ